MKYVLYMIPLDEDYPIMVRLFDKYPSRNDLTSVNFMNKNIEAGVAHEIVLTNSCEDSKNMVQWVVSSIDTGRDASNFMERLVTEKDELKDKFVKLNNFIGNAVFSKLDEIDRNLLREQEIVMLKYLHILEDRIERLTKKE